MNARRRLRIGLAITLAVLLAFGFVLTFTTAGVVSRTRVTVYFETSNGIYPGDDVRIMGVPVGKIESIEPQPQRVKITFWFDDKYKVPADAMAVVLSPSLVTARFIQLTPPYTGGPQLQNNALIPQQRTRVPVNYDDLRTQLKKLTETLQPTQPDGTSTLGQFVNTLADNLRGQGPQIRDTVIRLSQSLSILGDQSGNLFGTVKNLATLVSALQDSTDLMRALNQNLAAVSALLANDPNEIGAAVADLNTAATDVRSFVAENREPLGTSFDKLAEIAKALGESLGDIKQTLHIAPTSISNFINIYEPASGGVTGSLALNQFSNPVNFICGAIQAASRLNAEQSAKLCAQYLAPIVKNRQYNFLPLGVNGAPFPLPPFLFPTFPVGAQARPNEVTFSEDWMRPDFVPPASPSSGEPQGVSPSGGAAPLPAEAAETANDTLPPPAAPTDPAAGLPGMMVPPGIGS
jgi:phospholipid/cholesterol/gamma-HCH transport system substrate-binding protein